MKEQFLVANNIDVFSFYNFSQMLYPRWREEREQKLIVDSITIFLPGFNVSFKSRDRELFLTEPVLEIRLSCFLFEPIRSVRRDCILVF